MSMYEAASRVAAASAASSAAESGASGNGTQPWQKPASSFQHRGQVYWRHSRQKLKVPWNGSRDAVEGTGSSSRMPRDFPMPTSLLSRLRAGSKVYRVPQRSQKL